jgi:hypothetical protein
MFLSSGKARIVMYQGKLRKDCTRNETIMLSWWIAQQRKPSCALLPCFGSFQLACQQEPVGLLKERSNSFVAFGNDHSRILSAVERSE